MFSTKRFFNVFFNVIFFPFSDEKTTKKKSQLNFERNEKSFKHLYRIKSRKIKPNTSEELKKTLHSSVKRPIFETLPKKFTNISGDSAQNEKRKKFPSQNTKRGSCPIILESSPYSSSQESSIDMDGDIDETTSKLVPTTETIKFQSDLTTKESPSFSVKKSFTEIKMKVTNKLSGQFKSHVDKSETFKKISPSNQPEEKKGKKDQN